MKDKLAFAIQMEADGERYYLRQAEQNPDRALQRAFLLLAGAENRHAELLRNLLTGSGGEISGWQPDQDGPTSLFVGKADFLREAEVLPGQLEVYQVALAMEQKSISLYQELLADAADEPTRQLMRFLIGQERDHYALFDELTTLLSKPRDWIEAAEFGPRKEY
jgi:rubrerythrin